MAYYNANVTLIGVYTYTLMPQPLSIQELKTIMSDDAGTYKLSNNISRLLFELARDFERCTLQKCHERGHNKIRQSHSSLFSNLGYDAVRLTELARRAGITQQAMGKLVKEMEQIGYVKRHVDKADKRAKIIEATDLGKAFVVDSIEIIDEVIAEYTESLGVDGMRELEDVLKKSVAKRQL